MSEKFSLSYSAKKKDEVQEIREKYIVKEKEVNNVEKLKMLDNSVEKKARALGLTLGIIGALVLGFGMSCVMVWSNLFVLGVVVGIAGIAMVGVTYPVHQAYLKKERKKITPQVMALLDEIEKSK